MIRDNSCLCRIKHLPVFLVLIILCFNVPSYAVPIPIGEQIVNGGFGTDASPSLASWVTVGPANARASIDTINISGGNAGFNNFFTSSFAVLGDDSGNINGSPESGVSSIQQTFILPAVLGGSTVVNYDIVISFNTVFDGEGGQLTFSDRFLGSLLNGISLTLFSQNSNIFPNGPPSTTNPDNQLVNNPYTGSILGLQPGTYTLEFTLSELLQYNNTAAGIDNVSVTGSADVAAVPEPSTLLLLGASLGGLALIRRKSRK